MSPTKQELLAHFFTPERLAYYRDLHAEYPLWCGDWPAEYQDQPEYSRWWHRQARELDETERLCDGGELVALMGSPPERLYLMLPDRTGVARPKLQPIDSAILHAVGLTFGAHISQQGAPSEIEKWAERLENLTKPMDLGDGLVGVPLKSSEPINLQYLRRLARRTAESAVEGRSRDKLIDEMEGYWLRIGREIGALPYVKGGVFCRLPDKFLNDLIDYGKQLAEAVLDDSFDDETEIKELLRPAGYRLKDWPERLAFPMLSADELGQITQLRTKRRQRPDSLFKVVTTLVADRLPISRKTLLHRTAKFRI